MGDLSAFKDLLSAIAAEWDQAEADVKLAEQVVDKIVTPSIKELRYGGRRLVDVLHVISSGGTPGDIQKYLDDVKFNCHKARHDAVDAATSKIASDLKIMTEKIGYDVMLPIVPGYPVYIGRLTDIRNKIVVSRKDRQNRDKIYLAIENVELEALVKEYNAIMTSEPIMVGIAKSRRRERIIGYAFGIAGFLALILALIDHFSRHA